MTSLAASITHTKTELIIKRAFSVATVQSIVEMDVFPITVLSPSVDSLRMNQEKSVPISYHGGTHSQTIILLISKRRRRNGLDKLSIALLLRS